MLETGMRTRFVTLPLFAALLGLALAQVPKSTSGFQPEFLFSFNDAEAKVLSLAKAMPPEKYSWRPGPGVRSVGEVYIHIANGNRLLLGMTNGMPPREEFMKLVASNEQREKTITDKAKVVADLEASFKEVHHALEAASDAQLSKSIKVFGGDTTPRGVYMIIANHVSEHMGQSVAYARMNGIVPPWSRPASSQ
jgi:uncharacterized damage-inducible protein DinB